jgi:hypothetical protein
MLKVKKSLTLDGDICKTVERIENDHGVKFSTFVNRTLRHALQRPEAKYKKYQLPRAEIVEN